jgi:2-polyprenyl-6-methoxyphenol hydroxylase-like FAD-dependent oxidoreductase
VAKAQRRAAVIGGSISGLLAALALSRNGWDVDVFERVETELAGRGAGIVAQHQLRAVFAAIGLDPDMELGIRIRRRKMLDLDGGILAEHECPQTVTSWDLVYRLLRDAFPASRYHRGKALVGVEQNAAGATAHFAGGSAASADLVVGADGLRSAVRAQFAPDEDPLYAGYVAWRALIPEGLVSPATHRDLFNCLSFCLPPGEQCLGYPVAGPENDLRTDHRRYNIVWYRPADELEELPRLLTDPSGTTHSISIPPPLIDPAIVREMREAAARRIAPQFQEALHLSEHPFIQPIYDLEISAMAFGRVAVIGDAAFVARPHVGAGVLKAAEDALALANALEATDEIEAGLKRFEAARIGINRRLIERARHLGAYIQADRRTSEEMARAARHGTIHAVLTETALVDFLYD